MFSNHWKDSREITSGASCLTGLGRTKQYPKLIKNVQTSEGLEKNLETAKGKM